MASKARPSRGKAYAGGSRAAANEAALDDARGRAQGKEGFVKQTDHHLAEKPCN